MVRYKSYRRSLVFTTVMEVNMTATLIFICAISGAGKTTLVKKVLPRIPHAGKVLTSTTRAPRPSERNGIDYNFFSREEFEHRKQRGEFLETASVHGSLYGTRKADLDEALAKSSLIIFVIDVQGAVTLRRHYPDAFVFCISATISEIKHRLSADGNTPDIVQTRIHTARQELRVMQRMHFDVTISNHDGMFESATEQLYEAIMSSQRAKNMRNAS